MHFWFRHLFAPLLRCGTFLAIERKPPLDDLRQMESLDTLVIVGRIGVIIQLPFAIRPLLVSKNKFLKRRISGKNHSSQIFVPISFFGWKDITGSDINGALSEIETIKLATVAKESRMQIVLEVKTRHNGGGQTVDQNRERKCHCAQKVIMQLKDIYSERGHSRRIRFDGSTGKC